MTFDHYGPEAFWDDRISALAKQRYISLTTYRRDGRAVATPVWFVLDGTRSLVWTDAASGKAKRIRANGRVAVAPCDARGRTKAEALPAQGGCFRRRRTSGRGSS